MFLSPYFAGQDFGDYKIPPKANNKLFKVLGPIFFLLSIGFYYPFWSPPSIPAASAKWAHFTTIPNLDSLVKSFAVRTTPPPVLRLRFQANQSPVAFTFRVSSAFPVRELRDAILAHFGFAEHVSYDLSGYPIDGTWEPHWQLTVNGRIIDANDSFELRSPITLAAAGVRDSDLLRLQLSWTGHVFVSFNNKSVIPPTFPPNLDY
jgi:hypothetical protein